MATPTLMVGDPVLLKEIMVKNFSSFPNTELRSTPHLRPTPPVFAASAETVHSHPSRRHGMPSRRPEDFKIVFRPGGGLDLRTTTKGALLRILCTLATIDYATARTADLVRITPHLSPALVSTFGYQNSARGTPLAPCVPTLAPDNALRGIIYNAVDSQTQDEIVQDLQSVNVKTPYAIADARQMERSQSIVFNCATYRCHPCVPCCILCKGAHVTGSRPCKLRFDRNGPSSPPATSKPPPPAPPTAPIHKTSRPSRRRSASRGARWKSQPHTSDPQTAALKATIAAQQLQIQELSRQLQAALAPTAPSQTPPQPAPAEEPMNTAPSAASSRASSPTRHPPQKCRSPSSDAVAPEHDIVRKAACFLEAFEQRVMARFVRLEERIASVDNRVATIESHLTALDTRIVDWDRFRSTRLSTSSSAPITDLSAWTETLLADIHAATSTLPAAPHSTTADSRLLHLWEAYHAVHRRWQAQKHNRRRRLRLAGLASDMEEHYSSLLRQQWGQTCDRMAGNLGLRDTWSLLRVLLDPTHTKASQCKDISHLLHSSPLTDTDFLAALRDLYLCSDPPTTLPAYTASPNPDLEADISLGEVQLTEAHRTAQLLRLSHTRPGRALLSTLKLSPLTPFPTSLPIPSHVYSLLTVNPLPKNMHPEHHPSRRAARASVLWRQYERKPAVAYVDAVPMRCFGSGRCVGPRGNITFVRKLHKTSLALLTFEGHHVPRFVHYNSAVTSLGEYKRTISTCYCCGTVGHRPELCPHPNDQRGCHLWSRLAPHECKPSCLVCGEGHHTGSQACEAIFRRLQQPGSLHGGRLSPQQRPKPKTSDVTPEGRQPGETNQTSKTNQQVPPPPKTTQTPSKTPNQGAPDLLLSLYRSHVLPEFLEVKQELAARWAQNAQLLTKITSLEAGSTPSTHTSPPPPLTKITVTAPKHMCVDPSVSEPSNIEQRFQAIESAMTALTAMSKSIENLSNTVTNQVTSKNKTAPGHQPSQRQG
ncbi:hypothetical protein HPB49_015597 [Dermacentor silvarum]|uniref:Uncharacterized protein n=1 Tax=Dermacentor silvarum TaxID=543639 RepID=A0ACB8D699_DERSI|nr:hypothetical protein HPB49_015597 [Dermacentor silvarum]